MKNVYIFLGFLLFALGCSHDDNITTPIITDAPPINHARLTNSPNAREGCNLLWCPIRGAYETLQGNYPRIQRGATVTWSWYIASNPGNFGFFPLNPCQNLRLQIYGPSSANYPLVKSVDRVNNSNSVNTSYGQLNVGLGECGVPSTVPLGWYWFKIEWDAPNGGCSSGIMDFQVVDL